MRVGDPEHGQFQLKLPRSGVPDLETPTENSATVNTFSFELP